MTPPLFCWINHCILSDLHHIQAGLELFVLGVYLIIGLLHPLGQVLVEERCGSKNIGEGLFASGN